MKYNYNQLYVNIPESEIEYLFSLPNEIYSNFTEAEQNQKEGEKTVCLERALERMAKDIQYDS